ncbi:uncharacterized protein JN550_013145 [Neoarthrinium moseri]|uniref:uncharacterized protein n=1 Tax=Neoarthrinium moseri TaxID=1658444 RepID=UPI001FDAF0DD|nr:uncharacterized protein JN550_013145 [Neoarthrinium moseri]KAI1857576.1 hypothetical protein JN550_013145 [Neoarthrinium moseri]
MSTIKGHHLKTGETHRMGYADLSIPECPAGCWPDRELVGRVINRQTSIPVTHAEPGHFGQQSAAERLYTHVPIKPWQTRLLRIKPGPNSANPVECRLLVADILHWDGMGIDDDDVLQEVSYIALSYEWGSPDFSESVIVNNVTYPITANLFGALKALQSLTDATYLWVDALCINQHDQIEKSIQVRRMKNIYQKASRVVAWNPDWDDDRTAVLRTVLKCDFVNRTHSQDCLTFCQQFLDVAMSARLFERTWVRQEMFAAQNVHVQYGTLVFQHREVLEKVQEIESHTQAVRKCYPTQLHWLQQPSLAAKLLFHASDLFEDPSAREPTTLTAALLSNGYFKATDPRDLVRSSRLGEAGAVWRPNPHWNTNGVLKLKGIRMAAIDVAIEASEGWRQYEVYFSDEECKTTHFRRISRAINRWFDETFEPSDSPMVNRKATITAQGLRILELFKRYLKADSLVVFFTSIAFVHPIVSRGDEIVLLQGSPLPFLLRKHGNTEYHLVCPTTHFPTSPIESIKRDSDGLWSRWTDDQLLIKKAQNVSYTSPELSHLWSEVLEDPVVTSELEDFSLV